MLGHHLRHHFYRALVIKTLTRPDIQFVGDCIQLLLTMDIQVRALGQVLSDQAIYIFITATLPRTVRVAEVDSYLGALGDLGMARDSLP